MGYFFGFKLHLVVSDTGEILDFVITSGHIYDRTPLKDGNFSKISSESYLLTEEISAKSYLNNCLLMVFN